MDVPGFALITGAASGIGRACALAFAKEGSDGVALLDLKADALAAVEAEVRGKSKNQAFRVETYALDVSKEDQVTHAVVDAAKKFGRLDYVVNAAGIALKHEGGAAFCKTEEWQRVLDININGTFFVLRAAAEIMLKQDRILSAIDGRPLQRGSIVNLVSITLLLSRKGA